MSFLNKLSAKISRKWKNLCGAKNLCIKKVKLYRGADKSLARSGRKQSTVENGKASVVPKICALKK